jgi:DNA-binding beta-propeller fold protein YncE
MRLRSLVILAAACLPAAGGTIFLPGYPDRVLVIDEATQMIVDRIPSEIGIPTGIVRSYDRKKIYVTSNDNDGVEVVDIASHKVLQHFVLNNATHKYRINGVAPDPDDKLLYTVVREVVKQADRYDVGKLKYAVIDLAQEKIVRTADMSPEDQDANDSYYGRSPFHVSPDGKYIYQFRDKVTILDTSDFHIVDRIDLAKPDFPELAEIGMGAALDTLDERGAYVSLFNAEDPVVHRSLFGIAHFDLNSRQFKFTEIGPAPAGMLGLQVAPDGKTGYSVIVNGEHGNRRCEFWAFDITANRRTMTSEFPCRPRFSFGISSNGKQLYVYGAGFEIEVWDAATLKLEHVMNLQNDVTMGGIITVP